MLRVALGLLMILLVIACAPVTVTPQPTVTPVIVTAIPTTLPTVAPDPSPTAEVWEWCHPGYSARVEAYTMVFVEPTLDTPVGPHEHDFLPAPDYTHDHHVELFRGYPVLLKEYTSDRSAVLIGTAGDYHEGWIATDSLPVDCR